MQHETERLLLREFTSADFDDVHAYSSDYETVRHMMFGPNTPEQTPILRGEWLARRGNDR